MKMKSRSSAVWNWKPSQRAMYSTRVLSHRARSSFSGSSSGPVSGTTPAANRPVMSKGPVHEVAEVVGQVAGVAHEKLFAREIAVLAHVHLPDEEVAEGVDAEFGDEGQGVQ